MSDLGARDGLIRDLLRRDGRYGDIEGVCTAPVIAQLPITFDIRICLIARERGTSLMTHSQNLMTSRGLADIFLLIIRMYNNITRLCQR